MNVALRADALWTGAAAGQVLGETSRAAQASRTMSAAPCREPGRLRRTAALDGPMLLYFLSAALSEAASRPRGRLARARRDLVNHGRPLAGPVSRGPETVRVVADRA